MNNFRKRLWNRVGRSAFNRRLPATIFAHIEYSRFAKGKPLPDNSIRDTIQTFAPEEEKSDKAYLAQLVKEMLFCRYYYQILDREYFMYEFGRLTDAERKQYVGSSEMERYFQAMNAFGRPDVFANKEKTYGCYAKYFRRECLPFHPPDQKEEFLRFMERHPVCLLKPLRRYGGKGIRRLEISADRDAESVYSANRGCAPFLLEELIDQDPRMAAFHPQSVNTVRYNTFFHNDKLYKLQAVLRIGRGDTFLDNASSGGIYSLIDTDTGILKEPARSFSGELFECHPDTGIRFEGSQIPRWDELNALLEEIVRVIPEQKQVGWDFALSTNGWVLVEANTRPVIQSFDLNHGLRKMIVETFGQVVPVAKL